MKLSEFEACFSAVRPEITRWLESRYPDEGCGLLLKKNDVIEWVPIRNVAGIPRASFEIDPVELLSLLSAGNSVLCVVHSHVNSTCDFSVMDSRGATFEGEGGVQELFPGARHLVVSVNNGTSRCAKLYRFEQGQFQVERTYWQLRPNALPL